MGQLEAECAMTQMRVLSALKPIGTRVDVPRRRTDIISEFDTTTSSSNTDAADVVVPRDPVREMILHVDPSLLNAPANHVLPVLLKALRDQIEEVKAAKAARAARPKRWLDRLRDISRAAEEEEAAEQKHRAEIQAEV